MLDDMARNRTADSERAMRIMRENMTGGSVPAEMQRNIMAIGMDDDLPRRGSLFSGEDGSDKPGAGGGEYIRSVRMEAFRMTQDAFASMLGVAVSTLRGWESGNASVPKYVLRAVKVMAMDPVAAINALDAEMYAEPEPTGWDSGDGQVPGFSRIRKEGAVAWMKAEPERKRAMEVIDGLMAFEAHYRELGYPRLSASDLLLLRVSLQLEELQGKLERTGSQVLEKRC